MSKMINQTKEQYWNEVVAKSEGKSVLLPDALLEEAKKIEAYRQEFNKMLREVVAKQEVTLAMDTNNIFQKIRLHLEQNGYPGVFYDEVGWNADALADGVFVVNIIPKN